MRKSGFVTQSVFQAHLDKDWRVVHGLWPRVRGVAVVPRLPGGGGIPGGFTPGSVLYAGADGFLVEDNANLFWDAANQQLGIGTSEPFADCALHIEFPAKAVVISRLSAKERPWRQWECIDEDWGLAIGIHDAADGKIHLNYDSPIGTRIHSMIVFDGLNARVGIREEAPLYPLDVGVNTRIQGTLQVTGATTLVGGVQGDLDVTGLLTAAGGDFLVASGDALRVGTTALAADIDFHLGLVTAGAWDTYGFYWRYKGTGSGNDNTLQLWAQNQEEAHIKVYEIWQDGKITFSPDVTLGTLGAGQTTLAKATLADDARGLSSTFTLSADPAKSDGIALYTEGHIGNITTDGPTYGGGIWLNIDAGAILGADVRALDIGIYERDANCTGGNAYGLAIHMDFDIDDPPAAIYPFRLNCWSGGATPDALIFAANKAALAVTEGTFPFNNYLKIVVQDGTIYRIPLITEGEDESICLTAELRFYDNGNYVGFEAPALEANQIWVLPAADGNASEFLQTDGEGNLTWAAGGATDEKVKVDVGAVAGYLGAAFNDGVLRTEAPLTYADGGDFVTLGVDPSAIKLDDLGVPDDNADLDFSILLHGLVPKGTGVGHFLKDDGTWAAGGGGGAVIFPDLTDTPANYVGAADKIVKVNAAPNGLEFGADIENLENVDTLVAQGGKLPKVKAAGAGIEFGADIEDLEDVDTITGQAGKYAKVKAGDAGIEWDTPAGGNGAIDYLDNFEDASIHWSWRTDNLDGDRTIVEADNKLTIAVAAGTNYNWWSTMNDAPKIFTGIGRPPCEIIAKLITITTNNETRAGIFVASNPIGIGADYAMLLGRRTVGGVESLQVQRLGTAYTAYGGAPFTTLPIWLKIQITADIRYGNHIRFYFSVNGVDWTEMGDPAGGYSDLLTSDGFVVGLFAQNWNELAVSAEFDFFKVVPCLGADG